MQNNKDKIFVKQDNLYNFPYHYLPQKHSNNIFKPFRVHFWLYDYIFLINYLKKKIFNFKHDKFLDFGCGDGRFINEFQKSTSNKLYGYEISEKASLFFKAFNPESILINHFNELNKYEYFFDAVNFSEVIEHIPDENIGENIEIIYKIMKKGAILTITAPSDNHPVTEKHYRHYNLNNLLKNFDKNKFELIEKKFLFKSSIFKTIIRKIIFNRFFIINSNLVFKIYFYLNNFFFISDEKNCETIFLLLKKK